MTLALAAPALFQGILSADQSPPPAEKAAAPSAAAPAAKSVRQTELNRELGTLEEGLPVKKKELAEIHRKWLVSKGRTPTKKELEEFEKKRKKGEAKFKDNPFINKNPLSSPGRNREAYYKKLTEIRQDEKRIEELKAALSSPATP